MGGGVDLRFSQTNSVGTDAGFSPREDASAVLNSNDETGLQKGTKVERVGILR
jgi:hypothetical protein